MVVPDLKHIFPLHGAHSVKIKKPIITHSGHGINNTIIAGISDLKRCERKMCVYNIRSLNLSMLGNRIIHFVSQLCIIISGVNLSAV